jgi:hypothetical protein
MNVRALSEPIPCQRGPSHNAYISESITIHYRWSHLFQATLPVLRRMHREGGDCFVCEFPSGHSIAIPVWMTDQAVCAGFSVGPPAVSLPALRTLRTFLDGLRSRSRVECVKPSKNTSPTEVADEAKEQDKPKADRAISGTRVKQRYDPSSRKSRSGTQKGNCRATTQHGSRRRRSPKRR